MKINIIVPFVYRVGGIKLIFDYANRLTDLGHDIMVYYPIYPYNNKKGELDISYNLKRFYRLFKQLGHLRKNLRKFKEIKFRIKALPFINQYFIRNADICLATAWTTAYSVYNFPEKKGKKFYFVQDYENWESNIYYVDKSYKLGLSIITTCKYLQNLLLERFNVHSTVIFIAIDSNLFFNNEKVLDKPKRILFVYSGMERKNSKMAINVIRKIHSAYPYMLFESFGHIKFPEMPEYIKFTQNPSDDEIREIYCRSDIFLGTSNVEGFALPPAEAISCKCAIVSTKVGAVAEYSQHMHSALHVNPGDEDAMYDSVRYLIENPNKWKEISMNGYADSQKYLNCWKESVEKIERIFLLAMQN